MILTFLDDEFRSFRLLQFERGIVLHSRLNWAGQGNPDRLQRLNIDHFSDADPELRSTEVTSLVYRNFRSRVSPTTLPGNKIW